MAFGKFKKAGKRLMGKVPNNHKTGKQEDLLAADCNPALTQDVLQPPPPLVVDEVASTDPTTTIKTTAQPAQQSSQPPTQEPIVIKESYTDADGVLEGILQDLNVKVGQLAVDVEQTDVISEFSGGSAQSVESSSSEESEDCDGDDDDNEEEIEGGKDQPQGSKKNRKKKNSVADRVSAVVANAEEIRKKRTSPILTTKSSKESSKAASKGKSRPARKSPLPAEMVLLAKNPKDNKSKQSTEESKNRTNIKKILPRAKNNRSTTPQLGSAIKPKSGTSKSHETHDDHHTEETKEVSEEEEGISQGEIFTDGEEDKSTLSDGISYDEDHNGRMPRRAISTSDNSQNENSVSGEDLSRTRSEEEGILFRGKDVMNKDIIIHEPGSPSSLVVRAMYYTPLPASEDDIVIKVEASTVSFRDCLLRRGIGMEKTTFPFVPGCEAVGIISNLGRAARKEGYRVGDRVAGFTRQGGGNGYYAKLTTKTVVPVLGAEIEAAHIVCLIDVYMTAYQALRVGKKDGTPLTDANILITDGFSPVGQAAVQLAKLEGANVYVTTMESRQDEYMKTLGVKCLPASPSKWLHKLKGKMDVVIDNTCFDTYDSSWKALNTTGILVCTGMTSIYRFEDSKGLEGCGCNALGDMRDLQAKWALTKARYVMSQTKFHDLAESFKKDQKKYSQELKYLCFLVESGALKPKIAERVNIEEIPDAQRYLETGKANGTIVCLP